MPSLASRVASEPPTFSPALIRCTSFTISTVPLLILVGMFSACGQPSAVSSQSPAFQACSVPSCWPFNKAEIKSSVPGQQHSKGQTWKKDVWEGSSPVPPAGTCTSLGATRPTRAGAPTLYLLISSLTFARSPCQWRQL